MGTPNLAIAHIASNAASKEVVANAAFDQLDDALTNLLAHVMTDANYTLADNPPTSSEARYNMVYKFTGALTADRNIVTPAAKKIYIVSNQTTGGHNLIVKTLAGTGISIPPDGTYWMLYDDGTNVLHVSFAGDKLFIGDDTAFATVLPGYLNKGIIWLAGQINAAFTPLLGVELQCDGTGGQNAVYGVVQITAPVTVAHSYTSGVEGDGIADAAVGQVIPEVAGVIGFVQNAGPGTIQKMSGVLVPTGGSAHTLPDALILENFGAHLETQAGVGAKNYALGIDDQGTGDNDYAILIKGGKSQLAGIGTAQKTVTAVYTATFADHSIWADATTAAFAVTLPDATKFGGGELLIKKIDTAAHNVTVTAAGGQTIDGAATFPLVIQWKFVRLQSNGTNWMVVGSN